MTMRIHCWLSGARGPGGGGSASASQVNLVTGEPTHGCPPPSTEASLPSSPSVPCKLLRLLARVALQAWFPHLRPHLFLRPRRRCPAPTRPARRRRGNPAPGQRELELPNTRNSVLGKVRTISRANAPRDWVREQKCPRAGLLPLGAQRSLPSSQPGSQKRPHAEPPPASRGAALPFRCSAARGDGL